MRTGFSLKSLEVFEAIARTRSFSCAARDLSCSVSTVSQQLKRLESQLGVMLVDHTTRPISLTPTGKMFLIRTERALRELRQGETETLAANLAQVRTLKLGIIGDLDSDIAPELAAALAAGMPGLRLTMTSHPSHVALQLLKSLHLDIAFAMRPETAISDLIEMPVVRDPFVLASALDETHSPEDLFKGQTSRPFLRYTPEHIIAQQIEAHLKRNRISLENRFELDSIHSVMALVAAKHGWTITTALGYLRARRFHHAIRLSPLPGPAFARYVSLFARKDYSTDLLSSIYNLTHRLIVSETIPQLTHPFPWLADQLRIPEVSR